MLCYVYFSTFKNINLKGATSHLDTYFTLFDWLEEKVLLLDTPDISLQIVTHLPDSRV